MWQTKSIHLLMTIGPQVQLVEPLAVPVEALVVRTVLRRNIMCGMLNFL